MRSDQLEALRAGEIEFATMRPPGSSLAVLDRRVVVTGPPALAELSRSGESSVLDELVELLGDPSTAWPAEVLLAAMTRREEKDVEAFAADHDAWWEATGRSAQTRWADWLRDEGGGLRWDAEEGSFTAR